MIVVLGALADAGEEAIRGGGHRGNVADGLTRIFARELTATR